METTPLPPEIAAELENLRDIRLPEPVGWWPLAPGWWALVAALCIVALGAMIAVAVRRRTLRYRALRELDRLDAAPDLGPVPLAKRIEVLLKWIVLQRPDDRALASQHGTAWVERLTTGHGAMPPDIARFVAEAPYAVGAPSTEAPDRETLISAARRWIRRNT